MGSKLLNMSSGEVICQNTIKWLSYTAITINTDVCRVAVVVMQCTGEYTQTYILTSTNELMISNNRYTYPYVALNFFLIIT